MERKIYNKPFLVREQFMPQDFVAACTNYESPSQVAGGGVFFADIFNANASYEGSYGTGDGKCQSANEAFDGNRYPGFAPGGASNSNHFGHGWYRGVSLYRSNSTTANGKMYNTSSFYVIAGYANVDIYIGKNNTNAYIWKNGAPSDLVIGSDDVPVKNQS